MLRSFADLDRWRGGHRYDYCNAASVTSTQLKDGTYFKSEFGQIGLPAFETLERERATAVLSLPFAAFQRC